MPEQYPYFPQFSTYLPDYTPSESSRLQAATPAPEVPATGTGNWFTSGLAAGGYGAVSEFSRALQAVAQFAGAPGTAQSLGNFAQRMYEGERSYARPDLEADPWSLPGIGYQIARMIPVGAATVGGALVGAATAPEVAAGAGAAALAAGARAAAIRGLAGAATATYPFVTGENVQRQISETGQLTTPGKALAYGVPEAIVQGYLPARLESFFGRGVLRGIAGSAAVQGTAGGATEFLTQQLGDPNRDMADRAAAVAHSALGGAALGGILGGMFGGVRALVGTPAEHVTTENLDEATKPLALPPPRRETVQQEAAAAEAARAQATAPPVAAGPPLGDVSPTELWQRFNKVQEALKINPQDAEALDASRLLGQEFIRRSGEMEPAPAVPEPLRQLTFRPGETPIEMRGPLTDISTGEIAGRIDVLRGYPPEPPKTQAAAEELRQLQQELQRREAEAALATAAAPEPMKLLPPPSTKETMPLQDMNETDLMDRFHFVQSWLATNPDDVRAQRASEVLGQEFSRRMEAATKVEPPAAEAPPSALPAAPEPAAPAPVLNFTARLTESAFKKGMAAFKAATEDQQADMRSSFIDAALARGDKALTAPLKKWGKALDMLTPDGKELREEFIPERPPETPPGVEPEASVESPVAAVQGPIITYHGSPADFTSLKSDKFGTVDLTTDSNLAQRYARKKGTAGNLYRVEINAAPDEFLNLDKPLNEQPAAKAALDRVGIDTSDSDTTGLWDSMVREHGGKGAVDKLRDAGLAGLSREHGVYSLFDPERAIITHKNNEPIIAPAAVEPAPPPASAAPIKTAEDRTAVLDNITSHIEALPDSDAKEQLAAEAQTVMKLLPNVERNPGLGLSLNVRLTRLRNQVEAAAQRPAGAIASPDLTPSPTAEAKPVPTGDLNDLVSTAQDALYALRTKARGGLGSHPDAPAALDAHEKWLAAIRKATGPEELREVLARDPELDPEGDNLGNLTRISEPMRERIDAYRNAQGKVLQEVRAQSDSRARVISSRDGLPVTQLDADVTDMHQRGVPLRDVADHIVEHTPDAETAEIVSKLKPFLPEDATTAFRDGVTDKEGEYFTKQKTSALYNAADATTTTIHEMVHAVMHQALEGDSAAAETIRGIYDQLKDIGNHAGITDAHEMVAEAMANPVYRDFLKSQFVKGTSLWDRMIDTVRGFIGLDPRLYNAFDRIMSHGDDLMKEQRAYPNGDWVGPNSYARGADQGVENATNRADQAGDTLFQQVKDWMLGKGPNMRNAIRNGAFTGLDGHRIAELWGSAVASMRPYVALLSKEDTRKGVFLQGSQRGQDLANTLTDDGRALLNKALTATFNGMDPRKPATTEVSENPVLSSVHRELSDAYKQLIRMPNGEAAYEALRANMSTYHNIGLLDKLQAVERGLDGYTAPDRMNAFDMRKDIHTDPVKTERFFTDAVKNASDSLTAYREQLTGQKVTIGNREMPVDDAVKFQQALVDASNKSGGASEAALKTLEDLKQQQSDLRSSIGDINGALKDVANQRDVTAKAPYFHIGRRGNFFGTAKLALDPDGAVDQGTLGKFIDYMDNNGFADIAPMLGGANDTFYARVKNISEVKRLEQTLRDAQKLGLLSSSKDSIGAGEATQVFGSIASDSMRKAVEMMKANRPDVPEGVDPDAFNKAFGKQIADMQRTLLDMTSENSASRILARRKNVQGFDQDMIKSQQDAATTMSSHLANMTTAWEKGELMGKMRDEVKALNHSDADINTKVGASQAVGEFMLRDALRSAYVPSNPFDAARHITHTWAVGSSPAYFLMLMSQVPTTAWPELTKMFGAAATPAMFRAMPRTMQVLTAMAKSPDRFSADITYDALKAGGVDQKTIDEVMGNVARGKLVPAYSMAQTESMPGAGVTRTAVQAADALGKYAELIPRLIVSFAARDLYDRAGGYEHPVFGKLTADQAVDRAIVESQGEWAGNLAPRYASARGGFFGAATPMIDQFMGWQLRMSGKLYQEVAGMFDVKTRPEAARWLMTHAAATTFFAGTLGLPLASVAASTYDRLANWVTGRDDNDITASYRSFLSDTFGKDMGEIIARGAPRAAGMDFEHWGESTILPGSSAINILLEKRKFEDAERDWAKSMAGAGIGEMANVFLAARDAYNGDYLNGLIRMAPEILKAPAEAYRLGQRGFVNNLTGQQLPITANGWDVLKTALGIDPGKYAEYEEVRREAQGLQNMRELNSSNIVRHLEQAYMRRDPSMLDTWMGEAQKWQIDHPGMVPPQVSFGRELETHIRASAYARGMGLPIGVTPRDVGARGALRYGNISVQ